MGYNSLRSYGNPSAPAQQLRSPNSRVRAGPVTFFNPFPGNTLSGKLWVPDNESPNRENPGSAMLCGKSGFKVEHHYGFVVFYVPGSSWSMNKSTDQWHHFHHYNRESNYVHNGICTLCSMELPDGIKVMGQLQKMQGGGEDPGLLYRVFIMTPEEYKQRQKGTIYNVGKTTYPILGRAKKIVIAEK